MENINDIIRTVPLVLSDNLEENHILGYHYLPYSTGFEIECDIKTTCNKDAFTSIKNIMEVDVNNYEQRFRIPNGLDGLKCLFEISVLLKEHALINNGSGIHYHIDFTDYYDSLSNSIIYRNKDWILKELDTWDYKGTYNTRDIRFTSSHNWVRFQADFKTMEVRIGEMTFDYGMLFKRITHCNDIARRLKEQLIEVEEPKEVYKPYDFNEEELLKQRIIKL